MLLVLPAAAVLLFGREPPSAWLSAAAVPAVIYCLMLAGKEPPPAPDEVPVLIEWTDRIRMDGDTLRGFVRDEGGTRWYAVFRFRSAEEKAAWISAGAAGNRFHVTALRTVPDRPAHRYAFDMQKWLRSEGAAGTIEIAAARNAGPAPGPAAALRRHRGKLGNHIRSAFPGPVAAEAEALLIGERSSVDPDDERAYRRLGITHLFAISGLHVGILTYLLREGLLRLRVRTHTVRLLLLLFLPCYAMLAGGAPSVWRAVIIASLLLAGGGSDRLRRLDLMLSAGMLLFLLIHPHAVFQPGFQMSYAAAFALIHSKAILSRARNTLHQSFLVTAVCQIAVTPILLFHFFETSISAFLANLVFVPLFSVIILPANLLLLIFSMLAPPVADGLFTVYVPLRGVLAEWIRMAGDLPLSVWISGRPALPGLLLLTGGILLFFVLAENNRSLLKAAWTALVLPVLVLHFWHHWSPSLTVTFLDVGQGDAAVIELPYRRGVLLVDTGGVLRFGPEEEWKRGSGGFEVGSRIVVPFLKGRGIRSIDRLILSHPDADHAEAADQVIREMKVGEIHIGPDTYGDAGYAEMARAAAARGVPVREMGEGAGWSRAGVRFRYISPALQKHYEGNNDSLVLHVEKGAHRFLFAGDLELAGEEAITERYGRTLFPLTVLKAGHHGSRTSSGEGFLESAAPELTIFSAGRGNRYGHPHPEVVQRFGDLGLSAVSTADYGTVTVKSKRGTLTVETTAVPD
ncbi:DNA internalization-related competence protein ComEC/Rec2 [Edaphobacillus lindanitolerans]|uniref:Competence protein ComEC n=1 Tax=Edaphobacillus lindanitolerans TaxID=550447 RepID=A0A1U7PQ79_9BACI|nr:DNA internalization-related competence protein ComEC/Rec2 [Edaphobacillus lindanitolerans]SIT82539.1 competence protein ComEC [Edaphobacillus lindanitolerans]